MWARFLIFFFSRSGGKVFRGRGDRCRVGRCKGRPVRFFWEERSPRARVSVPEHKEKASRGSSRGFLFPCSSVWLPQAFYLPHSARWLTERAKVVPDGKGGEMRLARCVRHPQSVESRGFRRQTSWIDLGVTLGL